MHGSEVVNLNRKQVKGQVSQMVLVVKNLPANAGDIRETGSGQPLGWEDPLEEGMATHSYTEEPSGSMGSQRVGHD